MIFPTKFIQKVYFQSKTDKIEIEICMFKLVQLPNFSLNWQFWFLGPNLPKKAYLPAKTEIMNTIIEFSIFKLLELPNLSLNWKFWFFGPNLPKKHISAWKQKKWITPLIFAYSNYSGYQISALTGNFDILDQIYPKSVFSV